LACLSLRIRRRLRTRRRRTSAAPTSGPATCSRGASRSRARRCRRRRWSDRSGCVQRVVPTGRGASRRRLVRSVHRAGRRLYRGTPSPLPSDGERQVGQLGGVDVLVESDGAVVGSVHREGVAGVTVERDRDGIPPLDVVVVVPVVAPCDRQATIRAGEAVDAGAVAFADQAGAGDAWRAHDDVPRARSVTVTCQRRRHGPHAAIVVALVPATGWPAVMWVTSRPQDGQVTPTR